MIRSENLQRSSLLSSKLDEPDVPLNRMPFLAL